MHEPTAMRLLRIRHDRREIGFLSARLITEPGEASGWSLRVESPADVDVFHDHLIHGACMSLTLTTRDGSSYRGEACVSSVSDAAEAASLVVLAGVGPLRRD